jgi:hypothetical protein
VVPIDDVLIVAGLHVPLIPFSEVEGNAGAVLFWQSGPICVNVGVICVEITMIMVVDAAHWPAAGVNAYVVVPVVEVLITAGFHVPVIPLFDVAGKAGAVLFWQNGPICVNVGVICGFTIILKEVVVAHCPAPGVNVYDVVPAVAVLIVAGLHVPVMPLIDVAGNDGAVEFWQSGPIAVNVGVTCGLIVTLNVAVVAHCPAAGVNVYVVVPATAVLITAGFHVPMMPLLEVDGSAGAAEFWQSAAIDVNVGVICGLIVILKVAVVAHCPAAGVKV